MNTDKIINEILQLPTKFYNLGNVSFYSLLKETGYFEIYNQISEAGIIKGLTEYPEYINQWLAWSADKRSDSGWYFLRNKNQKYLIGFFPEREDLKPIEYLDPKKACAAFIKREIEEIRTS